jgi:cytochrome P450
MPVLTRHADVLAVLSDPRFPVPPMPPGGRAGTVAWLRANVARFSDGTVHKRRRTLATAALARTGPAALRQSAYERATAMARGDGVDAIARAVPVSVLAAALGIADPVTAVPVTAVVAAIARAYHPGTGPDDEADEAVAALVAALGGEADETSAARIGLLVQAYEATAGVIGNTALAMRRVRHEATIAAMVAETLRHDPPVRVTRRVALAPARVGEVDVPAGALVRLDLAAANRDPAVFTDPDRFDPVRFDPGGPVAGLVLTMGAGPHSCPGREHALAIATGVLDAIQDERPRPMIGDSGQKA